MAVLALGSPAKAAGSAQGSVRRVENKVRRQSEPPGSGCGAPRPGLAVGGVCFGWGQVGGVTGCGWGSVCLWL